MKRTTDRFRACQNGRADLPRPCGVVHASQSEARKGGSIVGAMVGDHHCLKGKPFRLAQAL
jgi:hypothetical protein